jgi:alkanesulfonate monooxygenase SsuD/methylene tetrahydromethanopterin reductase-like flavin-dependent oxidoreductase (luciferase family)
MTTFEGELGLQFTTHIAHHYTVPELVDLADLAHRQGFDQVWVNDNLNHRNVFVVLAAMAQKVPVKLGTAILVPYFRNPVDLADSIAAITEMTDGRELSIGIARGAVAIAGKQVDAEKPLTTVRETVMSLQALLAGETVAFRDYPQVASYFHLNPDWQFKLGFSAKAPVRFYSGGIGPRILDIAGRMMDGVLIGGYYIPLVLSNRLGSVLDRPRKVAAEAQPEKSMFDTCELNVSLSKDRDRAFQFAKPYVSHMLMTLEEMGFSDDDLHAIGVEPDLITALKGAFDGGASVQDAAALIPDEAVASCFVAGGPEECRDQILELMNEAQRLSFGQVSFAKLGPDYADAITLLREEVLGG